MRYIFKVFTKHPCTYSDNGCKEIINVNQLRAHEECCIYQSVSCPLFGCEESVILKNISEHMKNGHSKFYF